MKKESLNYYLYISWDNKSTRNEYDKDEFLSYMMVIKLIAQEETNSNVQILGNNTFMISSICDYETMKNVLQNKKFPHILVDVTSNTKLGTLSMYLDETEVGLLNDFITTEDKNQLDYYKLKLEESVEIEDYETAAFYRDLIKNNNQLYI